MKYEDAVVRLADKLLAEPRNYPGIYASAQVLAAIFQKDEYEVFHHVFRLVNKA